MTLDLSILDTCAYTSVRIRCAANDSNCKMEAEGIDEASGVDEMAVEETGVLQFYVADPYFAVLWIILRYVVYYRKKSKKKCVFYFLRWFLT